MSIAANKMKQLRALQKDPDKNLQQLVNDAYLILGNPIILYDADFKIMAYAEDAVTNDPIWNNHVYDSKIDKNIDVFINEGFVDIMIGTKKVVLLKSERLKYDRIFGKIFDNDNNIMSGVSIVASNKPFEDDDLMVTEAICKILSVKILKIPYYQNYAQRKLETYINMLIDNKIESTEDKIYATRFVEMIYNGLKANLYVAVADILSSNPAFAKLDYYRDLFKQMQSAFKYSVYSNYIIIIMSIDEDVLYPKKCFSRLNRLFEQENIKVGVSSRFENLFELKQYYAEAVSALDSGLKSNSNQCVFLYDEANADN